MRKMVVMLSLPVAVACVWGCVGASSPPPPETTASALQAPESWNVRLDTSPLEDLPIGCFRQDALVVMPRSEMPREARWTWVDGAPAELHVGEMVFSLGDAGQVALPPFLRGENGVFRATRVQVSMSEDPARTRDQRSEVTLALRREGESMHGTLHLEASRRCVGDGCEALLTRCAISVSVEGAPALSHELVAMK
jgi:hypothetical protein